jgi:hypothetical protein
VASAFALDLGNGLTLVGDVRTGISVNSVDDGKDDNNDTMLKPWNQDAELGFRVRTTFTYAGDWGGATIRFQADPNAAYRSNATSASTPVYSPFAYVKWAYGWANFLDKKIVVYGGQDIDQLWGTAKLGAHVFDESLDGVRGVRVAFNLIPELSFGFAIPFPQTSPAETSLGKFFGSTIFGGLYKSSLVSGMFGVKLAPST